MMNNASCSIPSHREFAVGSWRVAIDRAPRRLGAAVTDFATGVRWGGFGLAVGMAIIALTALAAGAM